MALLKDALTESLAAWEHSKIRFHKDKKHLQIGYNSLLLNMNDRSGIFSSFIKEGLKWISNFQYPSTSNMITWEETLQAHELKNLLKNQGPILIDKWMSAI